MFFTLFGGETHTLVLGSIIERCFRFAYYTHKIAYQYKGCSGRLPHSLSSISFDKSREPDHYSSWFCWFQGAESKHLSVCFILLNTISRNETHLHYAHITMPHLSTLPLELQYLIFESLSDFNLLHLSLTSHHFKHAVNTWYFSNVPTLRHSDRTPQASKQNALRPRVLTLACIFRLQPDAYHDDPEVRLWDQLYGRHPVWRRCSQCGWIGRNDGWDTAAKGVAWVGRHCGDCYVMNRDWRRFKQARGMKVPGKWDGGRLQLEEV